MNAQTETKAAHANVYVALAAAQAEMTPPEKNAENHAFKRDGKAMKYADLSSVVASIRAPLTRHGLAWGWRMVVLPELGMAWEAYIHHGASGTEVSCAVPIPNSANSQAMKSNITYAKRISIESVSGQAPADDDDGNAAAAAAPRQDTRPAPRAPAHRPDPSHDRPSPADHAISALGAAETLDALAAIWRDLPTSLRALPEVIGAKDNRKAALAAPVADPVTEDEIPY
jgi:hypothetical protein